MIAQMKDPGALAGATGARTKTLSQRSYKPVRAVWKDDLAALKARLEDRIEELLQTLVKEPGERHGHELRFGRRGSLAVAVAGPQRGQWFDFEAGRGGDLLALIRYRLSVDFQGALAFAKSWAGLDPARPVPALPRPTQRRVDADRARARDEARRSQAAWSQWCKAVPVAGTIAETYLRARGIVLPDWPGVLRFEPAAVFSVPGGGTVTHPALIAAVALWGDKIACAIQRTALKPDGTGKADLPGGARRSFGPARGGAVRLSRFEAGRTLVLAEGVETALACLLAMPNAGVWATLGTSGLRSVFVPKGASVLIAADADVAGRKAAHDLAQRLTVEGHDVRTAIPPREGADWNDLLRGGAP